MAQYSVKYRVSGILLIIVILAVVILTVFVGFYYLSADMVPVTKTPELKITEQEIAAVDEIQASIINNPVYKQLVPIAVGASEQINPTVKANPFQNKDQKE